MNYFRFRARKNGPYDSERINVFLEQDLEAMKRLDVLLEGDEEALKALCENVPRSLDGIAFRVAGVRELML